MAGRGARWRLGAGLAAGCLVAIPLAWLAPRLLFRPGGAGAYQDVPPRLLPDGRLLVTFRVVVWGAGGPAAGRFTNMRLQLRAAQDAGSWHEVAPEGPRPVPGSEGKGLTFDFIVPAAWVPPERDASQRRWEYRFVYEIDGMPTEVPGRY